MNINELTQASVIESAVTAIGFYVVYLLSNGTIAWERDNTIEVFPDMESFRIAEALAHGN